MLSKRFFALALLLIFSGLFIAFGSHVDAFTGVAHTAIPFEVNVSVPTSVPELSH